MQMPVAASGTKTLCEIQGHAPARLHRAWLLGCVVNEAADILVSALCGLVRGPGLCI